MCNITEAAFFMQFSCYLLNDNDDLQQEFTVSGDSSTNEHLTLNY